MVLERLQRYFLGPLYKMLEKALLLTEEDTDKYNGFLWLLGGALKFQKCNCYLVDWKLKGDEWIQKALDKLKGDILLIGYNTGGINLCPKKETWEMHTNLGVEMGPGADGTNHR